MLLSDLLAPLAADQWKPPPGPGIPILPKSSSNATATSIGVGPQPKQSTPAEMLMALANSIKTASDVQLTDVQRQQALQQLDMMKKMPGAFDEVMKGLVAPTAAAATGAASPTSGAQAGQPSGGGEGMDPVTAGNLVKQYESNGGDYNVGVGGADLSKAPKDENGFPIWNGITAPNGSRSHAAGAYQFQPATWAQYAKPLGVTDFSPESQDAVFKAAYGDKGFAHWAPFNPKLAAAIQGVGRNTQQPTQVASIAPQTMNDASPSSGLPAMDPRYVFDSDITPSNAGRINPGEVPNYGVPPPGNTSAIPPGYKPPTALAGAEFAANAAQPAGQGANVVPAATPQLTPRDQLGAQIRDRLGGQPPMVAPSAPAALSGTGMAAGGAGGQFTMGPQQAAIVRLGVLSRLGKMGDVATPLEQAFYNSPYMKGQVAIAENLAKRVSPEFDPKLQGQIAGSRKSEELPAVNAAEAFKTQQEINKAGPIEAARQAERYETVRPGSTMVRGGQPVYATPQIEKTVDPTTGQQSYAYMTPPLPGAPAPAPNVAALGPGQSHALVARATEEQKQRQTVIDEANAAQQSRATLMNMANEAGNFTQGPFAQHVQAANKYLRLISPSFDAPVASYEDFVKNAGNLTRQAVRETSARAAVQEFQMIGAALPSPEMSPVGLRRVQNELIGLSDYKIAKSQAQAQFEQANGGLGNVSGFEAQFQKNASPYAFIVARMDPADRREVFAKLQGSEQGRTELARLGQQLGFLKSQGLAQ